jgi:hypothetical protein
LFQLTNTCTQLVFQPLDRLSKKTE